MLTKSPSFFAKYGRLVKFSHTIFALPFSISMAIIIARTQILSFADLMAIILCLVAARSLAMAYNRLLDCEIDRLNPRTAEREIPRGVITRQNAKIFIAINLIFFLFGCWLLNTLSLILSPIVLLIILGYSHCKRFTFLSHLVLGIALSLAPGGVWVALTGTVALKPLPLMVGIMFWVAGFDILYSLQDMEFDRQNSLYSIPSKFGLKKSILIAFISHLFSVCCFAFFGYYLNLGLFYFLGLAIFAIFLFSQYKSISVKNLLKIDQLFFTRNGAASFIFMIGTAIDSLLKLNQ